VSNPPHTRNARFRWRFCRQATSIATTPSTRWSARICAGVSPASAKASAAFAGMAVTVLGRSALVPAMREIGPNEGLPPLPKIELLLYKSSGATSKAATALHDYLAHYLRLDEELSGRGAPI